MLHGRLDYFKIDEIDEPIPEAVKRSCREKVGDTFSYHSGDRRRTGTVIRIWDYFAEVRFTGVSGSHVECFPIYGGRIQEG